MLRRIVHRLARIKVIDSCPAGLLHIHHNLGSAIDDIIMQYICSCFWTDISDRHAALKPSPADSRRTIWNKTCGVHASGHSLDDIEASVHDVIAKT